MDEIKHLMIQGSEAFVDYLISNGHMPYTPHKKDIIEKYVNAILSITDDNDELSKLLFKTSLDIKKDNN